MKLPIRAMAPRLAVVGLGGGICGAAAGCDPPRTQNGRASSRSRIQPQETALNNVEPIHDAMPQQACDWDALGTASTLCDGQ
jgi:hypothetical protein